MSKDIIYNLVGASGSGKSTIAEELEKIGVNYIQSYTTREPRYEGERGHIFLKGWYPCYTSDVFTGIENENPDDPNGYIDIDDMIAYEELYDNHYFATREQYKDKGKSVYVVTPLGAEMVKENADCEVVTIFLDADEETRVYRIADRAGGNVLDYGKETIRVAPMSAMKEVADRIRNDRGIFKKIKCDYVIDANRSVEGVLEDIKGIIGVE